MWVAQNIGLLTHALSDIIIINFLYPDKEQKYRTVRLNTGRLATQNTTSIENYVPL